MKKKFPFNLILLGDPASGKATQAARLIKKYRLYDLDMGKEVQKPWARARHNFAKTTGRGKLTPTAVVRDILHRAIRTVSHKQGILFDGTPKMIGEAMLVTRWLKQYKRRDPLFIYLSIPMSEVIRRAKKRKVFVRGKLVKRDDDSERALKNRQAYYKDQVSRVVAFFKKKYMFKKISGMGNRAEVWNKITSVIDDYES